MHRHSGTVLDSNLINVYILIPKKGSFKRAVIMERKREQSVCYKLLSDLLTKRLNIYLEGVHTIPLEQYEFGRARSTETACRTLITDVKSISAAPRNPLYGVPQLQDGLQLSAQGQSR